MIFKFKNMFLYSTHIPYISLMSASPSNETQFTNAFCNAKHGLDVASQHLSIITGSLSDAIREIKTGITGMHDVGTNLIHQVKEQTRDIASLKQEVVSLKNETKETHQLRISLMCGSVLSAYKSKWIQDHDPEKYNDFHAYNTLMYHTKVEKVVPDLNFTDLCSVVSPGRNNIAHPEITECSPYKEEIRLALRGEVQKEPRLPEQKKERLLLLIDQLITMIPEPKK